MRLVGSAACGGSEGAGRAGVSQFVRDDRTGPAKADDHDIPAWQLSGHRKASSLRGGLPIGRAHYADGAERELLVVAPDAIAVVVASAWEADHLPGAHVAVSAVDMVGKKAFPNRLKQRLEEGLPVDPFELHVAALKVLQNFVLVVG